MARCFLDTNVLVYADDLDAGSKAQIAQQLIADAFANRSGVVSTQVLQEFFSVATGKLGVEASADRQGGGHRQMRHAAHRGSAGGEGHQWRSGREPLRRKLIPP